VISASGEKHAPIILEAAKRYGKQTFLISSSEKSTGRSIADGSIIMPKIREPYTYNTSTYFGYMLAETPDLDLLALKTFLIENLSDTLRTSLLSFSEGESVPVIPVNTGIQKDLSTSSYRTSVEMTNKIDFSYFSSFFVVLPDQFVLLREMIEVKFIELFGRRVARDIFSYEQMKHATTVVQSDDELFLCFGNSA
jgi:hypothetical protein